MTYVPEYFYVIFPLIILSVEIIGALVAVACYVMEGIALMNMAKNLGIEHPWMSWIPFAKPYLFGKISDSKNKKSLKIALLVLPIILAVLMTVFLIIYANMIFTIIAPILSNPSFETLPAETLSYDVPLASDAQIQEILQTVFLMIPIALLMIGVSIAFTVLYFIAYYRICNKFSKDGAIGFFIGGLVAALLGVSIVIPILLLVMSRKTPVSEDRLLQQ
ncbi:MAG: hypothetical protein J5874_05830 [Oscillospiraceae bacterium]|nr:hypothetical protein [Oscillospiraceae bacterium]